MTFRSSWSNDAHLWWTDARPGDELALSIPVRMTGRYKPTLQLTRAPDYGIVQLYLDDQPLGENIDLYNATVVPTGPLQFGERELTAGDHNLRVKIVGANPKAVKSYMFGLDYIKLELVPITRK